MTTTETSISLPDINLKKYDKVVLAAMVAGLALLTGTAVYGLYIVMPYLVELAKDTIYFFLLLAAGMLLLMFGAQAWMSREALYYKMKVIARNVRKAVVREDPIGVLDVAIHRFEAKLEDIDKSLSDADAARKRLKNRIRNLDKSGALDHAEAEEALAVAAQRQSKPDVIVKQHAVAADRWRRTAEQLQPMLDNLANMQTAMNRARDLCAATLEDRKSQKETWSVQLDAMRESQRSVRSFKRFLQASPDLDMIDLSIEEIERQSTEAEAEIDQFLHLINPRLETADLQNTADAEQALDRLHTTLAAGTNKGLPAPTPAQVVPIKEGVVVGEKRVH